MDRNQIKVLIRQMTLEEKAGQVTQLPSRYFAIQGSQLTGTETKLGISEEKKWLCGSILGKPILDMLREKAPETHRKDGQNLGDIMGLMKKGTCDVAFVVDPDVDRLD